MVEEAHVLTVGGIVIAAAVAHLAARSVRAPPAPFFIAAGFASRPFLPRDPAFLEGLLVLALAFLLFSAGTKLNPPRFPRATLGRILTFGLVGGGIVAVAGGALAHLAGWSGRAVPYAAFTAGASSTLIVLALLAARREVADAHGRLLAGGLLAQDAAAILLFVLVPNLPGRPGAAVEQALGTLVLAAVAILVMRVARSPVPWRVAKGPEAQTLLAFSVLFAFVTLAHAAAAPIAAAALLAGLALAPFPANVHARPAIRAAQDFFTPFFFVALGALFPIPSATDAPLVVALVALVLVVKPLVLAVVARALSFTRRTSAAAGLLSGQASEFALVLALTGLFVGDLTAREFGVLGLVVTITMLVSPLVPASASRHIERILPADPAPPAVPEEGHVIVLGTGRTGERLVEVLRARGEVVVGVDADPHALAQLPDDVPRVLGDATNARVLRAANVPHARAVVLLLSIDEVTLSAAHVAMTHLSESDRTVVARVRSETTGTALAALGVHVVRADEELSRALEHVVESALATAHA